MKRISYLLHMAVMLLLTFSISLLLPSCSKSKAPKGEWVLDCGMVESPYGDYHMVHHMNIDLENPSIQTENELTDESLTAYGTYDFSTMNRIYRGYIDSVQQVSKNVYVLHSIDTGHGYESNDTLRYYPDKDAFSFGFGDDMLFVKKEVFENANGESFATTDNTVPGNSQNKKENSALVTWIVILAAILLVLCIGIKISGEYDGWEFAVPLSAALAVLICIVGYNIMILDKIPGQLQASSSEGIAPILWMFGSMIVIAVSYFWSINIIQCGLAEEDNYVSIGCGKWVMILLLINVFAGMATEFQSFRDISSDFIGSISFKRDVITGILACSLALAILLTIIQIIQFFKNLNPIIASIATVLFPIYVAGGVAMCASCVPMLIVTIIAFVLFKSIFKGAAVALNGGASEVSTRQTPISTSTPEEIEFFENGSLVKTTARHSGCDIYTTSDGRKFKKDGDQVTPYEP